MPKVKDIAAAIEEFAPLSLQEGYDNAGLQVGNPEMDVSAALLCLDVTEDVINEAIARECNMIISHHPLLFKGLKQISGKTYIERIVIKAILNNIAIYSAHTNLDSSVLGVSHQMAKELGVENLKVLCPKEDDSNTGLGVIGEIPPTPKHELLRKIRDTFKTKCLKFSTQSPKIVIRKVALCGGAGAEFIPNAIELGADCYISGDIKYHDYTTWGGDILLADIGHYESELCARKIFVRILKKRFPEFVTFMAEDESNPIGVI
ncbi:MAG: Nif3-like dinuclear metal center hexameric protein [Prevotella sp.]|nr:Nif3-like dinuclear metal center hexameric protein [Bacteroides sp.]MCM1366327.1 Nif3-like dinuclear metal center hexameric protein [Prevotella sp.]MCM1437131.1 Nif3-like dinuclear metal center hexameric protein [Prevotella sp.]